MQISSLSDAPPAAPLGEDEVDVWIVALDPLRSELARALELLDATERGRCARVLADVNRERLTVARAVVRVILGAYTATDPAQLQIETTPAGKPTLRGLGGPSFNLSHAGDLAAVAVSRRPAVGVDIEAVGRVVAPGLLSRVLTTAEHELVMSLPAAQRDEAFLRHWTAKEAYLKATGQGLSGGLRSVAIADALGRPHLQGELGAAFSLHRLDPRPGVVGTVAASGGPFRIRAPAAAAPGASTPAGGWL